MVLRFVKSKKNLVEEFSLCLQISDAQRDKMLFTYLIPFTRSLLHINIFSFIYYMDIQAHSFQFLINSFFLHFSRYYI